MLWILDLLDGTPNFINGYPMHSVAVGVEIDGRPLVRVVHDTFSDRIYTGIVGEFAACDESPIHVRSETDLSQALIGTGFHPNATVRRAQADLLWDCYPS